MGRARRRITALQHAFLHLTWLVVGVGNLFCAWTLCIVPRQSPGRFGGRRRVALTHGGAACRHDHRRAQASTAVTMSSTGTTSPSGGRPRVLGLGSAGVDFIALVDGYPEADAKIRTASLDIMGGGNCGNTLCAASRLGLDACLATKVGSDGNGKLILDGLEAEGVDVSRVIASHATSSAFTYVIVDKQGGTRTCLHTPQTEDILPGEITPELLDGVAIVHLDSRHTRAAISLARLAIERRVPILLDAEKDRPHFRELLPLVDFVICNRSYPQAFSGSEDCEAALLSLLDQGRARMVATTRGAEGCIIVTREEEPPWRGFNDFSLPTGCPLALKTELRSRDGATPLRYIWAQSWPVDPSDIVDTTGAGDCFIAGFIYGITHRLGVSRTVALASAVAAKKLSQPGARRGVPRHAELMEQLPELLASA